MYFSFYTNGNQKLLNLPKKPAAVSGLILIEGKDCLFPIKFWPAQLRHSARQSQRLCLSV